MSNAAIFIVEDEAIIAQDIAGKLRRLDYTVCGCAACGEDAIALVQDLHPDLVLMDIRLKGAMDGVEAAERLRREYDVPVIYLTAHSDRPTLERAKRTEPFGYLLKPFEERELETHIEMALYKHQAERKLRESEERWATTLASIGDAVMATDVHGRITFMNAVAESLTGWTLDEARQRPVQHVFHIINEDSRLIVDDPVSKVLQTGLVTGLANHTLLLRKDGSEVPIDDSGSPIHDGAGRITGAVLVFRDITERKRAEEAVQRQAEQMKTFVQLVSHDLRAPLTITQGYVGMLQEHLAGSENHIVQLSIDAIARAVKRMNVMIEDLTMSARLEGGQLPLTRTALDLTAWLPEFLERSTTALDVQRLCIDLPATLPAIAADADRLERILTNLLSNALKYSDPGTPVRVQVQPMADVLHIIVQDEGQGIAPRDLPHLFEKFYRAGSSRKAEGIGLGLYVTRLMVEAHGGSIWAESEIGKGSTFAFSLPVA